jgi:1-acyl-sn-glycerol-3-phosphate acyltransferase
MLSKIRAIIVFIQFSISVAFVVTGMYIFKNHTHKIIKFWMKLQIFLLGIKFDIVGRLDESCDLVIMNHQSMLDIIVMEYLHPKDLAWVAKKEIADLFFFGHIIKAPRMISIDRENKAGMMHLIKEVKNRLSLDRPIAMFPEGTRSSGEEMLKFKSGSALVANKLKLKVQPVVIINTRNILDSKDFSVKPGIVKVIYLDTVQADRKTQWFKETEEKMNHIFNQEMKKYDT